MRRRRALAGLCGAALLVAGMTACKPKTPAAPGAKPAGTLQVPVVVRAAKDSNGGRPLYLVIRTATQKSFVEDDYSAVARLVVAPDETVLERLVVFPGQVYVVYLEVAKLPATLGVYGLFTRATGESWKLMFDGASKVELTVGAAALVRPP
jgi:predicted component of type VI protein secretion system